MDIKKIGNNLNLPKENADEKLKKACKDFEAVFINEMFKAMRKTVPGDDIFGKSFARDTYEDMYYNEVATKMSKGEGFGLADTMYRQLSHKFKKTTAKE
ncbi:MAG: rod-binding protein [Desulfobacterales bacterium]|nr:rod-binding protein [Desulfobacterales bacterium]MBF0396193.1 rod-binding protein [Desulfobacterales bacterium]